MKEKAQALGISHDTISTILHDRLGMRELTTRWAPKSLSDEQLNDNQSISMQRLVEAFKVKKLILFLRLVSVDETWVHNYEPDNKAQSRQWIGPGSPKPKKFKNYLMAR